MSSEARRPKPDAAAPSDASPPAPAFDSAAPSAVALARLSPSLAFHQGGEALYREILQLVELGQGDEFLVVPAGRGATPQYLCEQTGASGAGVDPDPQLVEAATRRARAARLTDRLHYETSPLHDLPYQDEVFDLTLGEIELGGAADPARAVRDLVRVTKRRGTVVLVQLVWTRSLEPARRDALVEHLGVRPYLLVEWKQMLRDAGVVDLYVDDWSDAGASLRQPSLLGGLAALFSWRGRWAVLPHAWRRWGWRGVRATLEHGRELRRLIVDEHVLGVSLIRGTRWDASGGGEAGAGRA